MPHVLDLAECTAGQVDRAGGKACGLGRLLAQSLDVPPGFVVTTDAYRDWVAAQGLEPRIAALLEPAVDVAGERAASEAIAALFEEVGVTPELRTAVAGGYAALGDAGRAPVAVRSSAVAEDTPDASFAGQQETYLWVVGADAVAAHVVRCWASLYTPQAISYRHRMGAAAGDAAMAVVVQRMVEAAASGVMITIDPVTGDRSQIAIEGAFGLGPPVVGGELTPDRWLVDKVTLDVRSRTIAPKPFADRFDREAGAVRRAELAEAEGGAPSLDDAEAARLAELGKRTERALGGTPLDMEWAVGPGPDGPRHLYLLQSRPETVWSRKPSAPLAAAGSTPMDRIVALMTGRDGRREDGDGSESSDSGGAR